MVLLVLVAYTVLGSQFVMTYPNYPKSGGFPWVSNLVLSAPDPLRLFLVLLEFSDGLSGLGIASIVAAACSVRIKYFWHWMAFMGLSLSALKAIMDAIWVVKDLNHILSLLVVKTVYTIILLVIFAIPIYLYRHLHPSSQSRTT